MGPLINTPCEPVWGARAVAESTEERRDFSRSLCAKVSSASCLPPRQSLVLLTFPPLSLARRRPTSLQLSTHNPISLPYG